MTEESPGIGHNNTQNKALIKAAITTLDDIDDKRAHLNALKRETLEGLEAHGISKKAVMAARAYVAQPEKKQKGYDLSYEIAREILGVPVQADMFGDVPQPKKGDAAADAKAEAEHGTDTSARKPRRGRPPKKKDAGAANGRTQDDPPAEGDQAGDQGADDDGHGLQPTAMGKPVDRPKPADVDGQTNLEKATPSGSA